MENENPYVTDRRRARVHLSLPSAESHEPSHVDKLPDMMYTPTPTHDVTNVASSDVLKFPPSLVDKTPEEMSSHRSPAQDVTDVALASILKVPDARPKSSYHMRPSSYLSSTPVMPRNDTSAYVGQGSKVDESPHSQHYADRKPCDHGLQIQQRFIDALCLPKSQLPKFDGNPLQYWTFKRSFDSCVGMTAVDDAAKLNLLFEACTGKAAKVIESCALMIPSEGLDRAQHILAERFGNPYLISDAWMKKVTQGPPIKPNNRESIMDFADEVRTCMESLRAMDMEDEIDTRIRMVNIVSRLPFNLQGRWRKIAVETLDVSQRYPNIKSLVQFLDKVARESNDPVFGYFPEKQDKSDRPKWKPSDQSKKPGNPKSNDGRSFNVQAAQKSTVTDHNVTRTCLVCKGTHEVSECDKLKKMSPSERLSAVKEHRLCYNCLAGTRHRSRWCRKPGCGVQGCTHKHSSLLHDAFADLYSSDHSKYSTPSSNIAGATSLACGSPNTCMSLPVIPVRVKVPGQNKYFSTQALLDPGSNRTFCTEHLIDKLGLTGPLKKLKLETLTDDQSVQITEVSFEVCGAGNKKQCLSLEKVSAIKNFPKLYGTSTDLSKWDHLKDVKNPETSQVDLLIGQDCPQALRPIEVRSGSDDEPYAVRTYLGWTINGPVGHDGLNPSETGCLSAFIQSSADKHLDQVVEKF